MTRLICCSDHNSKSKQFSAIQMVLLMKGCNLVRPSQTQAPLRGPTKNNKKVAFNGKRAKFDLRLTVFYSCRINTVKTNHFNLNFWRFHWQGGSCKQWQAVRLRQQTFGQKLKAQQGSWGRVTFVEKVYRTTLFSVLPKFNILYVYWILKF